MLVCMVILNREHSTLQLPKKLLNLKLNSPLFGLLSTFHSSKTSISFYLNLHLCRGHICLSRHLHSCFLMSLGCSDTTAGPEENNF